ncbi:glycoside hydrolase family 2 TIM barrel-domain containing protein [Paenibacillus sp. PL2-23]|uniref:glycoside hydrolase family 2 TIM barrel-domain containing protein n=1 Tax=Paenibacillus sp. PL2-23 TaxID=2100729 RepID=UPI0030F79828
MMIQQSNNTKQKNIYTNLNPIEDSAEGPYLQTTLSLKSIDKVQIPFQNGIPVPAFEPQERQVITLNGEWGKKRFDADHDLTMAPRDQAWLEKLEQIEGQFLNDNGEAWSTHVIPMPENQLSGREEAHAAETYENGVWYKRSFNYERDGSDQVVTLKLLGVSYVADIWVNGSWIGYHEGGFTPFAFDVTPFLEDGENQIRIRVDNPPWGSRHEVIPALASTDFFNYTGILQDIYLEVTNAVHMSRVDVVPLDTNGNVKMNVVVENRGHTERTLHLDGVFYESDSNSPNFLTDPSPAASLGAQAATSTPIQQELTIEPGTVKVLTFKLTINNPKLWSIWEPNLYVAKLMLVDKEDKQVSDVFYSQFGIRTLGTDQTQILLNEKPVFLAGMARHEEWPSFGRTASWDRILTDLQQIKNLNVNMVRTGHYPNHVYTYMLLDRLGLTAMSEIPLWQFETIHYKLQNTRQFADQMWREMVFSQYNRPSVIMWSTQNESKDVQLRLEYNKRLVKDLHEHYDDGRLITQSAAADQPGFNDPSMEPLDVAGWTMYFGVFHGSTYYEGTRLFLEKAHRAFPDKPVLNTEYGHWTGDRDVLEAEQVKAYDAMVQALLEKRTVNPDGSRNADGYVAGIDFWIMYDWYVNHNQWIDTFGAYHMDRQEEKKVVSIIRGDYGRAISGNRGLASGADLQRDLLLYEGEDALNHLSLDSIEANLAAYEYLNINVFSEQSTNGVDVILEDQAGNSWTYASFDILAKTSYPIYIPLYRAEGINLSEVKSITVKSRIAEGLKIESMKATVSGAKSWMPN